MRTQQLCSHKKVEPLFQDVCGEFDLVISRFQFSLFWRYYILHISQDSQGRKASSGKRKTGAVSMELGGDSSNTCGNPVKRYSITCFSFFFPISIPVLVFEKAFVSRLQP